MSCRECKQHTFDLIHARIVVHRRSWLSFRSVSHIGRSVTLAGVWKATLPVPWAEGGSDEGQVPGAHGQQAGCSEAAAATG